MTKYQNKYRTQTTRMQNWDYGWNAHYFVTICTYDKEYYFGDIISGEIKLSEIGKMAEKYWLEIPEHFPFVKLDCYVVMPNHVHGIIVIDKPNNGRDVCNVGCGGYDVYGVETQNFASLPQPPTPSSIPQQKQSKNQFGPQSKNLGSIIRGYKIGVTKYARNNNIDFKWQPKYHDHIIRDETSYQRIRNYIINNPKNWKNNDVKTP